MKDVAVQLGINPAKQAEVAQTLIDLYNLFLNKDASMVEINPFAEVNIIHCTMKVIQYTCCKNNTHYVSIDSS